MRGKVNQQRVDKQSVRITPAYAGKRVNFIHQRLKVKDHPRLCGEKDCYWKMDRCTKGSPPPMRGKVFFFDPEHLRIRITPAYAGKR